MFEAGSCEECRFFKPVDADIGRCRRYPLSVSPQSDYKQPRVLRDDWCGEFRHWKMAQSEDERKRRKRVRS